MLLDQRPYTFDRVTRIGIGVGLIWGLIWLLGYLSDVLIPFAVAFLLAYLINPLVLRIQRKAPNRAVAVFASLFIILFFLVILFWIVAPLIAQEVAQTGRLLSGLVNNSDLAARAAKRLPPDLWQALKSFAAREEIQQFFRTDSFWKLAQTAAGKILPGVWGLITGTASFLMGLVGLAVVGLYMVFLLLDYQTVKDSWKGLLPPSQARAVAEFVHDFNAGMQRYFRGQALVASIVGVLFAIGFVMVGLPLGILLGLFIGLLNMVPYLQIIGLIPAFILAGVHALETGSSFGVVLGLTGLVFVVVQAIQDIVLTPRIMGKVTGLRPAVILLSLSVWGKLLGFLGLIIALPLTVLLYTYYRRFILAAWQASGPPLPESGTDSENNR